MNEQSAGVLGGHDRAKRSLPSRDREFRLGGEQREAMPSEDAASLASDEPGRRLRVLLVAYSCVPGRGSEPGVGWNRAVETARRFDTWVLCNESESAEPIERFVADHGPVPGLRFVFLRQAGVERLLSRVAGFYVAYNLWHRRAYRAALRLHKAHRFDVVHQVTLCGYREPGYVWRLDAPFVWGPVGGTQNYPWRFLLESGVFGLLSEGWRNILNTLQLRFSPRVRSATRRAAVVFAANSTNRADLRRTQGVDAPLLLETALTHVAVQPRPVEFGGPLRIIWSGTLTPNKGLSLLLKALAELPPSVSFELRVYGAGPYRRRWQRLARRLGLEQRISWMGWVPREEVLAAYLWADVLVFTSLRDTSGNALLEALGCGVPVVCLAHQGAGDIVTPSCGVGIPVTTPGEVVVGLRNAIIEMSRPGEMSRLRRGALERARQYLWSGNAQVVASAYYAAARRRSTDPFDPLPLALESSTESGR